MSRSVVAQNAEATREDLLAAAKEVVELFRPDTIAEMLEEIQRRPSVPMIPHQGTAKD